MPRLLPHPSRARSADDVAALAPLDRLLRGWLMVGVLALTVPGALDSNHFIGCLPYWLCVAPAISLALLHRRPLVAASSALLSIRGRRRRKPSARRIARRLAGPHWSLEAPREWRTATR